MASQDELLTLLQQLNARSAATVKPQVEPTKRTNAVMQNRNVGPKLTDTVSAVPNLPTGSVDTINAQNKLSAYSMDKQVQYPKLTDQIRALEAGNQKPSGALGVLANVFDNPVAKTVLAPLTVLDTGRRAIISGVREVVDLLDTDKNTKASLTDWFKQTKDPAYGFGTAFPMKGWAGRVVGLIGDIALDPLTYATLGTTIPETAAIRLGGAAVREGAQELVEAGVRGAARAAAEDVAARNLRAVLGRKSLATAEGRTAMAGLVGRMGGSDELVKAVASEGRRAFRTTQEGIEMAQRLGLNRSGIYYFGSRVRVPFSGPIADFIETGIVKSRLGIMRSAPGEWLAKNFTTAGTSSARTLKDIKRGLALGTLGAKEAAIYAKMVTHESASRAAGAIAKDTFAKLVKQHLGSAAARGELFDKDILEHAASIYRYLDTDPAKWAALGLPEMTEGQKSAYQKIQNMFREFHTRVEEQFKTIDPNFTLNKVTDYFPHMMTDEAYKYVSDNSSKYAEQIRQYLKINMTDPGSSFKSRGLVEKAQFFGKTLTEEDVAKGVEGLNQIARDAGFKGNFFETDITKVLPRYGSHYSEQFATAEFMRKAIADDILRVAKEREIVDEDWLKGTSKIASDARNGFAAAGSDLRQAGSNAIDQVKILLEDIKTAIVERQAPLKAAAKEAGTPEQRLAQLTAAETRLGNAAFAYKKKFEEFAAIFSEQSELVAALKSQLDATIEQITRAQNDIAEFASSYRGYFGQHLGENIDNVLIDFKGKPTKIADVEKALDNSMKKAASSLEKMQSNWETVSGLHDQINEILNKRLNIEYGTGIDVMDEVFDTLQIAGVRDATSAPTVRTLPERWIGSIWYDESNPAMVQLRQAIDPNGQLSVAQISKIKMNDYYPEVEKQVASVDRRLKKIEAEIKKLSAVPSKDRDVKSVNRLTQAKKIREGLLKERSEAVLRRGKPGEKMIPGIRTRISRGLTIGDNMLELREAAVWLIMRDIKLGSTGISLQSVASQNVVEYVSRNFGRYEALLGSLREAERIQGTMTNRAISTLSADIKDAESELKRLVNRFDRIPDEDVTEEMSRNFVAEHDRLRKKIAGLHSQMNAAQAGDVNLKGGQDVLNRIGSATAHKELVQQLAANTSEYFMHRETVIQFRRLASALDSVGMVPTQNMYNRILASVAQSEFENMNQFGSKVAELTGVLKRLRDSVNATGALDAAGINNDVSKQVKLAEELAKIFDPYSGMSVDNPAYLKAARDVPELEQSLKGLDERIKKVDATARKVISKDATAQEKSAAKEYNKGLDSYVASLRAERDTVAKNLDSARQNLKALPKTINGTRDAELIREFMPEMEAIFLYNRLDKTARLFYRDAEGQQLMQEVLDELRAIGKEPEWGKPVSRKARVIRMDGEDVASEFERGFGISGGSDAQRLARVDQMQNNFEEAIKTLQAHYARTKGTVVKGVTRGQAEPLVQNVGEEFGAVVGDKVGAYRERYKQIIARIKRDAKDAQKRAEAFTKVKGVNAQRQFIKNAMRQPELFGFGYEFNNALEYGGVAIDDFFSSLVGGMRLRRGTRDYTSIIKKGKSISNVRGAEFEVIDPSSSYFGKLENSIYDRTMSLRLLMDDPAIPTNVLLEGDRVGMANQPNAWVMGSNLRSQQAYADALEEHADSLMAILERDKEIAVDLKKKQAAAVRLEKEYDNLVGGPGMKAETPRTARLIEIEKRNAQTEAKISQLKATAEHTRAETMQREHLFAMRLARYNREDVNYMLSLGGPNMQKYHFSADEWDALWSENVPEESLQSLRGRKGALSRELGNLPKDNADSRWQSAINPKVRAKLERAQAIREQIAIIDAMIAKYDARTPAMAKFGQVEKIFGNRKFMEVAGVDLSGKPTMSSADSLFAIGNASKMSQYFTEIGVQWPPSTQIDSRLMMLDSVWKSSPEYKHLRNIESLTEQMNWYRHEQFVASRARLLQRHAELRQAISSLREESTANVEKVAALEENISSLLEKTKRGAEPPKVAQGEDLAARQARARAAEIRTPANQIESAAREYVTVDQGAIDAITTPTQQELVAKNKEFEEIARMVENLQFEKIVAMKRESQALDYISFLNDKQKGLLRDKIALANKLAKEQGVYDQMATGSKAVTKAEQRMLAAAEGVRVAQVRFDNAQTFAQYGPQELQHLEQVMSDLRKIAERGTIVRGQLRKGTDVWVNDVHQLLDDSMYLYQQIMGEGVSDDVRNVVTSLIDSRNEFVRQSFNMTEAQTEKALADGIKAMMKGDIPFDGAAVRLAGGKTKIVKVFDDGFVQLSKYFPDIGVRKEVAEIYQNVHRIQQPLLARELSKFLSKYTGFFKAYATLSPGFHVRNSISNGFMLFAAGGNPVHLSEGLKWSRAWTEASRAGKTFEEWIAEIPMAARRKVEDAFKAAAASGGGMTDEMIQNSVPFGTKGSRKLGRWIEQHSRFMLAYDGIASGMDFTTASARVKRFLIDYQDISTADAYMRQIVPFWMWTSRNLPMQLQNMWMNPRAYAIYNNIKRNIEEKDPDKPVPLWMRELGAFKLPGTNFYATPDLGFNRVGQQLQELRDPRRALANVNPLLRIPIELTGGRQLYSNRQFSDQPIEVKDGAGALLQPLLQLAGYGETTPEGKKFVNDKAYYALRNLIPFLGTAERLTPSIQTYQQRGYVNPLLGFLGVPTRQLTEADMQGELARRKREIQNIVSKERTLQGNE